jgi:hypothetical protein
MEYHILNGDALAEKFPAALNGKRIVCRECLVDGPLEGDSPGAFWQTRAQYLSDNDEEMQQYYTGVRDELEQLLHLPEQARVALWFEHDLFCQANMWFVLSLLKQAERPYRIMIVYPYIDDELQRWKGFGIAGEDSLAAAWHNKLHLGAGDMELGAQLWEAFRSNDHQRLASLSQTRNPCFPYLREVCEAHLQRFPAEGEKSRPEQTVADILQTHPGAPFYTVFHEFFRQDGIYGFSDLIVKRIYDKLLEEKGS